MSDIQQDRALFMYLAEPIKLKLIQEGFETLAAAMTAGNLVQEQLDYLQKRGYKLVVEKREEQSGE